MAEAVGEGFGVQIKETIRPEDFARIRQAGFGFVRLALYWDVVEKTKGRFDWSDYDPLIAALRAQGLHAVMTVTSGHAAYDGSVRAPQPNKDRAKTRTRAPARAESVEAFTRFAAAAAKRYGGSDIVWEIWNEPDSRRFWAPRPDVNRYAALMQRSCAAIRAIDPQAIVMGPALAFVPDGRDGVRADFLDEVLRHSACLSAVSVHPYRHGREAPETALADYAQVTRRMALARTYVPLINSEWGYSSARGQEEAQADFVLRTRLVDMMWGVPRSVWYEWQDSKPASDDAESGFGLVRMDGREKQAFRVLRETLPRLAEMRLDRRIITAHKDIWLLLLRKADGSALVAGWSDRPQSASFELDGRAYEMALSPRPAVMPVAVPDSPQTP